MKLVYNEGGTKVVHGLALEVLRKLPDSSIAAVVTDPPYGLSNTDPKHVAETIARWVNGEREYVPHKRGGFMGKEWDSFVPPPALWDEVLRVLKPGGHLLCFAGSRTIGLMEISIRLAGFDIRDSIAWLHGQGFPKSANPGCQCDPIRLEGEAEPKAQYDVSRVSSVDVSTAEGTSRGPGPLLLPSLSESSTSSARRSELSHPAYGVGESSLERRRNGAASERELSANDDGSMPIGPGEYEARERAHSNSSPGNGTLGGTPVDALGVREPHRPQHGEQRPQQSRTVADEQGPQAGGVWQACKRCGKPKVVGLGTALKPAFEPIIVARKPLSEKTVAANVLAHGTGALNIDATRIATTDKLGGGAEKITTSGQKGNEGWTRPWMEDSEQQEAHAERVRGNVAKAEAHGRWPANVVLDETQAAALDAQSGTMRDGVAVERNKVVGTSRGGTIASVGLNVKDGKDVSYGGGGGASRFFYVAKAPKSERPVVDGVAHPTVKPLALMEWLVRMVTPSGGVVLDPFAGSGTTAEAAKRLGFKSISIEMTDEYIPLILSRIERTEGD